MANLDRLKSASKNKPPTQTAGVSGIDGYGGMGEAPEQSIPNNTYIDWFKLVDLPAFQMFVAEQSGLTHGITMSNWIKERRATLSDSVLYDQYASWHEDKGLWVNETPMGVIKR
ncbi:hypothetical protein [Psychrobacter sp.]|uniref:hypothetical protein n=1 Tax=Psychrobacter sp. TaxID=56811 RepID=UPI002FDAAE54